MVKYELARYKKQNGQICASSIAEITENQYKQICNCFSFVDFYHTCKCLKLLVVENEKNLSKYFVDLKTEKRSYSELELEKLVTQADFLLINYLSSVNTFIDVMSNLISKKNLSKLDEFKKLDSKLYDDYFSFRFMKRLRNYTLHYSMPFKHISNSIETGITIGCIKEILLEYGGWSKVKKEIKELPEIITLEQYLSDTTRCINDLYLYSLKIILDDVVHCNSVVVNICDKYKVSFPSILVTDLNSKSVRIHDLPLYIMNEYILEVSNYPSFNVGNSDYVLTEVQYDQL